MMMVGISPSQSREFRAGATRQRITLAVDAAGEVVTIGDRKVALAPDTLVLWHQGDAGTWWGLYDPTVLVTQRATEARPIPPEELRGVVLTSASGGGDGAAVVVKVDRPLAIVTSGYQGRRGWKIMVVAPDGQGGIKMEFSGTPTDYRARFAPVETL